MTATLAKNFSEGGINAAPARKRSVNSDQARRKVDGRQKQKRTKLVSFTLSFEAWGRNNSLIINVSVH